MSKADEIKKLKELLDSKAISEEEYEIAKKDVLSTKKNSSKKILYFLLLFLIISLGFYLFNTLNISNSTENSISTTTTSNYDVINPNANIGAKNITTTTQLNEITCNQFDEDEIPSECIELDRIAKLRPKCIEMKTRYLGALQQKKEVLEKNDYLINWLKWSGELAEVYYESEYSIDEMQEFRRNLDSYAPEIPKLFLLTNAPILHSENPELDDVSRFYSDAFNAYAKIVKLTIDTLTNNSYYRNTEGAWREVYSQVKDFRNIIENNELKLNGYGCNF